MCEPRRKAAEIGTANSWHPKKYLASIMKIWFVFNINPFRTDVMTYRESLKIQAGNIGVLPFWSSTWFVVWMQMPDLFWEMDHGETFRRPNSRGHILKHLKAWTINQSKIMVKL